jgi:hypothetical protein
MDGWQGKGINLHQSPPPRNHVHARTRNHPQAHSPQAIRPEVTGKARENSPLPALPAWRVRRHAVCHKKLF